MRESANPANRSKLIFSLFCVGMTVLAAVVPFARAFYRVEVDYNEGWNIYNAAAAAAHQWPYPVRYGWTTNNYPMLSFVLMAQLHRLTHEYLFTARMVSLAGLLTSGVLVGAIVYRLAGRARYAKWTAVLAGLFTVAIFCANTDVYVGMDDPQMLAQVFFLAGLYVYIATQRSVAGIAGAALLFAVGGFIKHNPVDLPLAVLIDLAVVSRWRAAWRAVWFSVCGLLLLAAGLALNLHYGGPHFFDQLLAPRSWSLGHAALQLRNVLGPVLLPFGVAGWMAWRLRRDSQRRVAAIWFLTSLLAGAYFGGGQGVSMNSLFDTMLASSILAGVFLSDLEASQRTGMAAAALFAWLTIPLLISGNWNVVKQLRETATAERRFDREVATLAARPGPALCESLLRCYAAGKPYIYDPFNATRLVELGKLDQSSLVAAIRERRFAAIQLDVSPDDAAAVQDIDPALYDRFTPEMLGAVRESYVAALSNQDGVIYVPAPR